MAFCSGCGAEVAPGTTFCPKCGRSVSGAPVTATPGVSPATTAAGTGLQENVAAMLSYVLGWLTGLIFFMIDKRPFVRFHAMQSIIVFGALFVIRMVFIWGGFMGGFLGFGLMAMLGLLVGLLALVLWVVCM